MYKSALLSIQYIITSLKYKQAIAVCTFAFSEPKRCGNSQNSITDAIVYIKVIGLKLLGKSHLQLRLKQ